LTLKLNILFFTTFIFACLNLHANQKYIKYTGIVQDEKTTQLLNDVEIKIVYDDGDSIQNIYQGKYSFWLPANKIAKIYFSKKGYITKHAIVDASFIPAHAQKKKQAIESVINMTKEEDGKKYYAYDKPIYIANYKANKNVFILTRPEDEKKASNVNLKSPFPAPVDTYKNIKPTDDNIGIEHKMNENKMKKSSPYSSMIQGVLFADLNYCIFNERISKANDILNALIAIDKNEWGNIKPFDEPEYGKIVMRTLNNEKSKDTIFAFAVWVETSRIIMENFSNTTKLIVHFKTISKVMTIYVGKELNNTEKNFFSSLKLLIPLLETMETNYTQSLKDKKEFNALEEESFLKIKAENLKIYHQIID